MSWLRVTTACNCLCAPTGAYRVTHKRAKEVILKELGYCPKGKPGEPKAPGSKFRTMGFDVYTKWLGITNVVNSGVSDMDTVELSFIVPKGSKELRPACASV